MGCVAVRAVLAQMRWRTASAHLLRGLYVVFALDLVKALPGKVSLAERKAGQDGADTDRVGSCM